MTAACDTDRWERGPAWPLAPLGEVHVWRADLDAGPLAALTLLCSDGERARADDIRDASSRGRYIARRGLHRLLVAGYAVGNHRMELHTVSAHFGADVLFAIGRTVGLGLSIVPIPELEPHRGRLPGLNNRERLGLRRLPPAQRARAASAVLAAKEAIGAARGRGLDHSTEDLELLPTVAPVAGGGAFCAEFDGVAWTGTVLRLGDDQLACVVHDGGPRPLRAWTFGR